MQRLWKLPLRIAKSSSGACRKTPRAPQGDRRAQAHRQPALGPIVRRVIERIERQLAFADATRNPLADRFAFPRHADQPEVVGAAVGEGLRKAELAACGNLDEVAGLDQQERGLFGSHHVWFSLTGSADRDMTARGSTAAR
jgi:hypothetical protein